MTPPSPSTSSPEEEEEELTHSLSTFLSQIYPQDFTSLNLNRPFITLTYAQSIDGKIAGIGNQQIMLSGKESMMLTHKYVFVSFPAFEQEKEKSLLFFLGLICFFWFDWMMVD